MAAVLDGLSAERAQALVIGNLTAAVVSDRAKHALAARATQRGELEMLGELRRGIEAGIVTADGAVTIAQTAGGRRSFGRPERDARRALKEGDLDTARAIATSYHARLGETEQTINAARAAGAKLKRELPTFAQLQRQRLDSLRAQIAQALKRRQQQAQPAR